MELFVPNLSLTVQSGGEFTVQALTLMPNGMYSARPARAGVPSNIRLRQGVYSVLLPVRARRGPFPQMLTPVRHILKNQSLEGIDSVLAFLMLGTTILGSASITASAAIPDPGNEPAPLDTSDWAAWVNQLAGAERSLHVSGTVRLPSPGYTAELQLHSPQGINPRELVLDLRITKLPGVWPQHVFGVSVRYDVAPFQGDYDGVTVRIPHDEDIHFEVDQIG